MKPRRLISVPRQTVVRGYPKSNKQFKPLRFYVAGGPDIDGTAMKKDERSMSDPDSDSDAWMSLFGTDANGDATIFADPFCDPRHDVFSIAAMSNSPDYKAAVEKALEQQQGGTAVAGGTATADGAVAGGTATADGAVESSV